MSFIYSSILHNILTFILSVPTPGVWTPTVGLMILLAVQVYGKVRETHATFDKLRVIGKCHLYIVAYVHNILTFILSDPTPGVWTPTVGLMTLWAVQVYVSVSSLLVFWINMVDCVCLKSSLDRVQV